MLTHDAKIFTLGGTLPPALFPRPSCAHPPPLAPDQPARTLPSWMSWWRRAGAAAVGDVGLAHHPLQFAMTPILLMGGSHVYTSHLTITHLVIQWVPQTPAHIKELRLPVTRLPTRASNHPRPLLKRCMGLHCR